MAAPLTSTDLAAARLVQEDGQTEAYRAMTPAEARKHAGRPVRRAGLATDAALRTQASYIRGAVLWAERGEEIATALAAEAE